MSPDFAQTYADLRALMLRGSEAADVVVATDETGKLELRTPTIDPKTKEPGWVGMIAAKKAYVSYHLPRLYDAPELAETLSPELARRRTGKTCFNFKKPAPDLYDELEALTRRATKA